ncbi:hypothetical protein IQ255_25755 [Pleurocapsales cyanobacterium LEGE 10410]|nr:hypothetical protein [Pleurocapsales cyanobacterium LEGE 10410]
MLSTDTIRNIVQYVTEGFMEIFRPNDEQYPMIGVQPFSGTINHHRSRFGR